MRSFRIDKIRAFINRKGETIPPGKFFSEILGIDLRVLSRIDDGVSESPAVQARVARDALRPFLQLLVLAARSDGDIHPAELEVILSFARRELSILEAKGHRGIVVTDTMMAVLAKVITELRVMEQSVPRLVRWADEIGGSTARNFWNAMQQVVSADGKVTDAEAEFLAEIRGRSRQ